MSLSLPTQLTQAFCSAGVKNTIPNPSQVSVNAGLASFTDGFPPATRAPVASGGIPPYGEDMNGILNQLSTPIQWQQAGGAYPYSSAFAAAIGGYPLAGRTYSSDGSGYWLNTTAGNTNDPENTAAPNGWQPVDQRGITTVPLTNANVTLTNLQSAKDTVVFTGALTGPVVVTVAQFIKDFRFVNQTTGGYPVQVKTPAGSALTLPAGPLLARGDGTTLIVDATSGAHGQCVLSVSSGTVGLLSPFKGNNLAINGVVCTVPSAGVSFSNTGLANSTDYYAYVYMSAGVMTGELSTTGYTTQANGITTKTGDVTRTFVGMLGTNASGQFQDDATTRLCCSFFNRKMKTVNLGSITGSITSTTAVATNASFTGLALAGDASNMRLSGYASVNAANGYGSMTLQYGAVTNSGTQSWVYSPTTNANGTIACEVSTNAAADGRWTVTGYGFVDSAGHTLNYTMDIMGAIFQ